MNSDSPPLAKQTNTSKFFLPCPRVEPTKLWRWFVFPLSYMLVIGLLGRSIATHALALVISFGLALILTRATSATDCKNTTTFQANLLLGIAHLPFLYFFAVVPAVAKHQSADLTLVSICFAILFGVATQQSRTSFSYSRSILRQRITPLILLLIASLGLRLRDLSYNAPYIDELLNFQISTIGNFDFIASDSRLWGVLARFAYNAGELPLVRATNALLGTLAVALVFFTALAFNHLGKRASTSQPPVSQIGALVAAALFSFSAPVFFTSLLGTHDMLALLFFIGGLCSLLRGAQQQSSRLLLTAALLFFLAFTSRYFILVVFPTIALLTHGPWSLLRPEQRQMVYLWFYYPLTAFFSIYCAFAGIHVIGSVRLGAGLSRSISELNFTLVASALVLFILPLLLLLMLLAFFRSSATFGRTAEQRRLQQYLLLSAALLPMVQLLKCSDFGSEKNLSYTVLFAAILIGHQFERTFESLVTRKLRLFVLGVSSVALFLGLNWGLTVLLLPHAIRIDHRPAVTAALEDLRQQPLKSSLVTTIKVMQQRWLNPEPVLTELQRLGLDRQKIAVFGMYGGEHTSWYLTHYLGRNPLTGAFYVDQIASSQKEFFRYSYRKKIPVLLAVLPEAEPLPYAHLPDFPQYHFFSSTRIEKVEGTYGRVFLIINPAWLDMNAIPQWANAYFLAHRALSQSLPAAAAALELADAHEALLSAEHAFSNVKDPGQRISLLLQFGHAYALLGNGPKAAQYFTRALNMAQSQKDVASFSDAVKQFVSAETVYREQLEAGASPSRLRSGKELLPLAHRDSTSARDAARENSRSYWLEFEPPIVLPANTMLRLETTLRQSSVQALRIVQQDQDYSEKGQMEVLAFSEGRQVIYLWNPTERQVKRIDMQVGPEAWGTLGGSLVGELEFHSVSVEPITPLDLYLSKRTDR